MSQFGNMHYLETSLQAYSNNNYVALYTDESNAANTNAANDGNSAPMEVETEVQNEAHAQADVVGEFGQGDTFDVTSDFMLPVLWCCVFRAWIVMVDIL